MIKMTFSISLVSSGKEKNSITRFQCIKCQCFEVFIVFSGDVVTVITWVRLALEVFSETVARLVDFFLVFSLQ